MSTVIVKQKDLNCAAKKVNMIDQDSGADDGKARSFWKTLGGKGKIAG